jgi:hypothetical protein
MHLIKATDLTALRKIVADREPEVRAALVERLDPETRACFESATPVEWVPAHRICSLHVAAADILFPGEKAALTRLGQELATRSFSTIYKILMAVPSFSFVVRRTPTLWALYHGSGKATIEDQTPT